MEVSIWIAVGGAVIAALPGIVAALLTRKTSQEGQRIDHLTKATEGFAELVEDLRIQIDREREECLERVERCNERIKALTEIKDKLDEL
jgi:peptidoglycan hydrolase CwlO-like protein